MEIQKLACVYNVWDACELLPYSLLSIRDHVDEIIFVYQNVSNFGEEKDTFAELAWATLGIKCSLVLFEPIEHAGAKNETIKRNLGLTKARELNCTHFFFIDADEIWADFAAAKHQYLLSGAEGSVAEMYTYFRHPTLRLENVDNYFVPFIHKLRPDTVAGLRAYPFYVDPTRRVNCTDVALINERMHHFSWVRRDIAMKIRNSSAKVNIEKSQLRADYDNAHEGMFLKDYGQSLIEVRNRFNIQI